MRPYQDIVRAWATGGSLEGLTPEQQRAVGLIASGTATDAQLAAAGSEFVAGIKAHLALMLRGGAAPAVKANESRDNVLTWKYSDERPDRMGDIIRADGWVLENYKANPVILWGHANGLDAIADEPIGRSLETWVDGKALYGDILFAVDASERAARIYRLAKAGFVSAGSVGFRPLKTQQVSDEAERTKLGLGRFGVIFEKQELLEFSLCAIPANPNALQQSVKAGAITAADADEAHAQRTERDWDAYLKRRSRSVVSMSVPTEPDVAALSVIQANSLVLAEVRDLLREAITEIRASAPTRTALAHAITDLGGCLSAPRQVAQAPAPATNAPALTAAEERVLNYLRNKTKTA